MSTTEITWNTTDISMERIEARFGNDFVAGVLANPIRFIVCRNRATGAWDANDREGYAFWRSLAERIREREAEAILA